MSMFKMENTEGFPTTKAEARTYEAKNIHVAVKNYVLSWDYDALVDYAVQGMYKEYMDRTRPRVYIDNLMKEFGENQ